MKKPLLLLIFAALFFENTYAQKLPNKQEASVRLPLNVKIDGKATEWNNLFMAYNIATELSYTLANNNEELYLVIQTKSRYAFSKITFKGLTLSVKNPKSGKNVNITIPHNIGKAISSTFSLGMTNAADKVSEREIAGYNKWLSDKHKFIRVEGIEGVDSLISIYNEKGIRAAQMFDNNKAYTLEMSINLKLLGVSVNDGSKISYQLKVNPMSENLRPVDLNEVRMPDGGGVPPERRDRVLADLTIINIKMYGGTEFKGEYTLAK